MCLGGKNYTAPQQPQVMLPPAPQISLAPSMLQSTPAPAGGSSMTNYQKKGKRSLTIPQTSVNVPGA